MIGQRGPETANLFIDDLQSRLANRVQLTTDGLRLHLDAVAAGIADRLMSLEDVVGVIGARAPKPGKRGPYKKRAVGQISN